MYIVTQTFQFPTDAEPEFYQTPDDVVAYVLSNYSETKFGTEVEKTDKTVIQTMYWNSEKDYLDYMDDPFIRENLFKPKKHWVIENKIILTTTYKSVVT
jgi:hypothetical protein